MSRVPIERVLASLDQQVQPRPEFSDALLMSLLDELEVELERETALAPTRPEREPRPTLRSRFRLTGWPRVVLAGAVALLIALTAVVVDILPGQRSAAAVVSEARARFAELPPFEATVVRRLPGESIAEERVGLEGAPDMLVTRDISYLDEDHWRVDVTDNNYDDLTGELGQVDYEPSAGSFTVADGEYLARYTARDNLFDVAPIDDEGLGNIRLDATVLMDPALRSLDDPTNDEFEERCEALDDVTYAGRPAHRIHCVDLHLIGTNTDVWFDVETGLVLRLEAEARPGADLPAGEGAGLFHDVTALSTDVDLSPNDFVVEAPEGARVIWSGEAETPEQFRTEVDPDVTATIRQRGFSGPIIEAGDYIWASGLKGGKGPNFTGAVGVLARIDPATNEIIERIPLEYFEEYDPKKYARGHVGPLVTATDLEVVDDELWVAESHNGSEIPGTLDPDTGYRGYRYRYWVSRFDLATGDRLGAPMKYPGNAYGIAVGVTGVWLSSANTRPIRFGDGYYDFGSIVRVDPTTGAIDEVVDPFGVQWSGDPTVAYGSVWVSWTTWDDPGSRDDFGRNVLLRVNERSLKIDMIDLPTDFTGEGRQGLIAARGSIWMTTEVRGRGLLLKIDPKTNRIVDRFRIGKDPYGLVFGEGYLWAVDHAENVLMQIDPRTGKIIREVKVPAQPTSLAVGDGALWVNTLQDGIVARVDIYR